MRRNHIKQLSPVVPLLILVSLESSVQALRVNDSLSTNHSFREAEMYKKTLVRRINQCVVTLPCVVLFTLVFACNALIVRQQKLHGWIVLAISGSFALRFAVRFLNHLPILYLDWNNFHWTSYKVCVTFGKSLLA